MEENAEEFNLESQTVHQFRIGNESEKRNTRIKNICNNILESIDNTPSDQADVILQRLTELMGAVEEMKTSTRRSLQTVGLLHFPDELLLHISHYLSVRDILSCCLVCHKLRELLNDDKVWRRRVSSQAVSRLGACDQLVAPPLSVPDTFGEQRTLFAWQTRLINNWRSGHCVEFDSGTTHNFEHQYFYEGVIYEDRYVFVGRNRYIIENQHRWIQNTRVDVWDVRNEPVLYATVDSDVKHFDKLYIIGTKLFIVACYRVIVYEIKLPETVFPLLYSFLIDGVSIILGRKVHRPRRPDNKCDCGERVTLIMDRYLISNKASDLGREEATVLEIWDISEGTKLGSFATPIPGFYSSFRCIVGDKWVFQQTKLPRDDYCLLQFDFPNKQFSDWVFRYAGRVRGHIVHGDKVILFTAAEEPRWAGQDTDIVCMLFDHTTGMELNRRRCHFNNVYDEEYFIKTHPVFDNKFVMTCEGSFQVVDVFTLETIAEIPCDDVVFISRVFKIFDSVFVLAHNETNKCMELWDIENKRKACSLSKMPYATMDTSLNDSSSTLISFGSDQKTTVSVVHFW